MHVPVPARTPAARDLGRPRPEDYQPAITWWGHTWRTIGLLTLSLLVVLSVDTMSARMWVLQGVVGVVALALVPLRRRAPLAVAVATGVLGTFSWLATGPAALAAVSLATRRRWREILPIAALAFASGLVFNHLNPPPQPEEWWVEVPSNAGVVAAMMAWGMYVGSRRELLWTLRARAERAESEQELRATQARLEERGRIAREMHDVLAHRISQISMHAGALSYRGDLEAEQIRSSATVIQETAHQALTDLRGVLGVLRDPAGHRLDAPQPTYADLATLLGQSQEAGINLELDDQLATANEQPPAAAGRTLYRIVQEGITNAAKHSPGARLSVAIDGDPEHGIDVVLTNPLGFRARPATPGAGLGLVGLTERAQLRGGWLTHGPEQDDFVLRGWIPWTA